MCNSDMERRQAWREMDGFAKATDRAEKFDTASGDINPLKGPGAAMGHAESPLVRFHHAVDTMNTVGRSPLFVSMALGFHTQLDYQPVPYPAQREICEQMVKLGLLREDPVDGARFMHYVPVQEALRIYVEALCRVPLPVKRWVLP